jgi:hypothetical protein
MKPIVFKNCTCEYAKHQKEFKALPAFKAENGEVITCWQMTWKERFKSFFTGKVWLHQQTYNNPLQAVFMQVDYPFTNDQNTKEMSTHSSGTNKEV